MASANSYAGFPCVRLELMVKRSVIALAHVRRLLNNRKLQIYYTEKSSAKMYLVQEHSRGDLHMYHNITFAWLNLSFMFISFKGSEFFDVWMMPVYKENL